MDDIGLVGYAARLPGSRNADELWNLLIAGQSALGTIPEGRWSSQRFCGGDRSIPGRTVTRTAGVLDDIWAFDAARFNISPSEARQMDPQQRILLELVSQAFDHAGLDPDMLDRTRIGVFAGASSADHSTVALQDPAEVEPHFMLGNTLSILANRISFIWDLRGPSVTVDTACSSSLVAFDQACRDIREGRIDTAIVAGVSILLSPIPFVGFSQAGMLSPRGLCCPFAEGADGYVRAEGAVVVVLQRYGLAQDLGLRVRSVVAGSGVNTVGRSPGITVPSAERQAELMASVLSHSGTPLDDLVYVEAHGTGTAIGDPIEAQAIGLAASRRRTGRLAIGSIKSNIGHLEPASGLAGLLKAQLILEHGLIPPSLNAEVLNPAIDFRSLNIDLVREVRALPQTGRARVVGVNSFGFGGVNAHVLLREVVAAKDTGDPPMPPALLVTAPTAAGVRQQIEDWRTRLSAPNQVALPGALVANANWNRARHRQRLCLAAGSVANLSDQIDLWLSGQHVDPVPIEALGERLPVVFVFSGNGAVWAGMAQHIHREDAVFRRAFDNLSRLSLGLGGPDLAGCLMAADLEQRLEDAEVAQPLHYAIQVALCRSLAGLGIRPAACVGHSLGEVAAAVAAGRITDGVGMGIVISRARVYAPLRGTGTMAALAAGRETIRALIAENRIAAEISAENAPAQVTVAGTADQLDGLIKAARRDRIAGKMLGIAYPYHSRAVQGLEAALRDQLAAIPPEAGPAAARFYSGCLGLPLDDRPLDAEYWVGNALHPVEFRAAVESACRDGFRLFLEISPRTVISGYVRMILDGLAVSGRVLETLDSRKAEQRSAAGIARRVLSAGGAAEPGLLLGPRQAYRTAPPSAPFERRPFRLLPGRGPDIFGRAPHHPLLGARTDDAAWRWQGSLSLHLQPWLAQHRVAGRVLFPATAMIEVLLQAARQALSAAMAPELRDVEFLRPIEIPETGVVDLLTEWEPAARRITLSLRIGTDWVPAAVCRAFSGSGLPQAPGKAPGPQGQPLPGFYERLRVQGLDYGPQFALLDRVGLADRNQAHAGLRASSRLETGCLLDPAAADACLHAAALLIDRAGVRGTTPMVPTRIGRIRVFDSGQIGAADLLLHSATRDGASLDIDLRDGAGCPLARFDELRLRPFPQAAARVNDLWVERPFPLAGAGRCDLSALRSAVARPADAGAADVDVLRAAAAARVAWDMVGTSRAARRADATAGLDVCTSWLVAQGHARPGEHGIEMIGACPWPSVETLLPLLAKGEDMVGGEFASLLAHLNDGRPPAGKPPAPLPRLLTALREVMRRAGPTGRIALVGPVGRSAIAMLTGAGHGVTLVLADAAERDATRAELDELPGLRIVEIAAPGLADSFDVVFGAALAQTVPGQILGDVVRLLAPGGVLVAVEELADLFALVTGRHRSAAALDQLREALANAGLEVEVQQMAASETLRLITGRRKAGGAHPVRIDVFGRGALATMLRELSDVGAKERLSVVLLDGATDRLATDVVRVLRALPKTATVWLLDPGLDRFEMLTGWRRVLANETGRDLRLCSVSADADPATLLSVLTSATETEVRLDGTQATGLRLFAQAAGVPDPDGPKALRLEMASRNLMLERPVWQPVARRMPGPDEVEIAVEATGLNFRDVMWAQGLIPPEGLEGGFAGQGFGMECAGRVLQAGAESGFRPGQKVAAFAPHAFATHVTVPGHAVLALPDGLSCTEGAALPVVFLTADYALTELARLAPGETVLVHGGAGGVGLAALQIARNAGARVLATAGSPARRRYLRMIGAEATFDSRSLAFVDAVRAATGGRGVDVVLNSLAGEALELGLSCLAPFGRFVELGKRDIFQNSALGMRVLKNNISLMAVDVDQLLHHRPQVAQRVMLRIAEGLASGDLQPLPVSSFEASETAEAFRLMLRSGQIGKIVVRPPTIEAAAVPAPPIFGGCWLVTGGTDGFGLATAEWLVRQGARRLWLTSRSGRFSEEARARLAPARVQVRAADVSDWQAMERVADEIAAAGGGLDGIVHSAGVLRDALFRNLDDTRISEVQTPKVRGAEVLDRIARRLGPRHFWLFSSVSARFGNPGQAPYAAANRALEALAAHRHAEGLPALAIAWGPIGDVGMVTRDLAGREALEQKMGPLLTADRALNRLAKVLVGGFRGAVLTIAPVEWGRLVKDVPVLSEPLFDFVPRGEVRAAKIISLADLVADLGEAKARKEVMSIITAEMGRILRCAPAEVDPARPMTDLGFDSLMAVSLRLAIEERLGIELSFQALAADMTLQELVHRLFDRLETPDRDDVADYLQSAHGAETSLEAGLREKIIRQAGARKP